MAIEIGIEVDDYLQQLFRGGTPSIALRDFIFQTFSNIGFLYVQSVSYITNFTTKNGEKTLPPGLYRKQIF